jgi:hypothetical protein
MCDVDAMNERKQITRGVRERKKETVECGERRGMDWREIEWATE